MKTLLSLILILTIVGVGEAATYYVRTDGHDTNCNGTANVADSAGVRPACAYKTIAKGNSLSLSPGDYLKFKDDQTWRNEIIAIPNTGTVGNNITITRTGDGTNKPIIDPSDKPTTWTHETITATFAWEDSITFENAPGASTQWSAWWVNAIANGADDVVVYHDGAHSRLFNKVGETDRRDATFAYLQTDFWYRVDSASAPSENNKVEVIKIYNGITNLWLRYNTSKYWLDISNNTTVANTVEITPDTWYHINYTFIAGAGTGSAELKVDTSGGTTSVKALTSQTYSSGTRFYLGNSGGYNPDKFKTNIDTVNSTMTAPSTFTGYYATYLSDAPNGVWNGTTPLTKQLVKGTLTADQFYNDTGNTRVYVRLTGEVDPEAANVSVGNGISAVQVGNVSYQTYDGLDLKHANGLNGGNVLFTDGTTHDHIKVTNSELSYSASNGIFLDGTGHGIEISNNNIFYNTNRTSSITDGGSGIVFYSFTGGTVGDPILIHGNTIYSNAPRSGVEVATPSAYVYVYSNTIRDNGTNTFEGSGISFAGADVSYCKAYDNLIYNQKGNNEDGNGIISDTGSHHNQIYYNVIYGNDGAGIGLHDCYNIEVYNNVVFGNGLNSSLAQTLKGEIRVTSEVGDDTTDITIKNNIGIATKPNIYGIYVDALAYDNTLTITNNDWRALNANWYFWNATGGATLATWNALTGVGMDLNSDPKFNRASIPLTETTSGFAIGPDGTLYVGSTSGKVRKSTDNGITWSDLKSWSSATVPGVWITANGYLYASPSGASLADENKGLWRSTDAGANWTRVIDLSAVANTVYIWGFDEDSTGKLFAGVYSLTDSVPKIYRSTNSGTDWAVVFTGDGKHIHQVVADRSNNYVYATQGDATTAVKIIRSTDSGDNWGEILTDIVQCVGIVITPTARIFGSDSSTGRIFRTTDDSTYSTPLTLSKTYWNYWIARDPSTGYLYASFLAGSVATDARIYRSVDDGVTWTLFWAIPAGAEYDGTGHASNIVNSYIGISSTVSTPQLGLLLNLSTSNFHLLPNSPAINAGVAVGLTSDYEGRGVPVGSAPDIGAYEKSAGQISIIPGM